MSARDRDGDSSEPAEYAYDPELPFLAQLEREVRRDALRAARHRTGVARERRAQTHASAGTVRGARACSRELGSGRDDRGLARARGARRGDAGVAVSARIARRSLTLVALLCLIGATAYGAHRVLAGGSGASPNPAAVLRGAFVLVAQGGTGAERWSLRLYRRGEDLCRVLLIAGSEASRCTPAPGPHTLAVTSVVSPLRRYLFGVTGSAVAQVAVHAGASHQTVATRTPDAAHTRAAGLPARMRYFVAILIRPRGRPDPPALVRGLDAQGRPTGRARVDCVQAPEPRPCPSG